MDSKNASSSNCSVQENYLVVECICISSSSVAYTGFFISHILLIFPVCLLIFALGLRHWWQQRFLSTAAAAAAAATGDSNVFIHHLIVIELIGVVGSTFCCVGLQANMKAFFTAGFYLWNFPWYGETSFHILTCVEHYLAVVRPITYLISRSERGIRIRHICSGCVWLVCLILTALVPKKQAFLFVTFILAMFATLVISFCSISVLIILIRPGPGEKSGSRGTCAPSKMKAFNIVMLIQGVVSLRLLCNLAWMVFYLTSQMACELMNYLVWFNLPCTLLLPLLFLQRSGAFPFCMCSDN